MSNIHMSHAALQALGYVTIQRHGRLTIFRPTYRFLQICQEVEKPMGQLLPFPSTYRGIKE